MDCFVGRIEILCIVSQIELQPMKVGCDFVQSIEALFRYLVQNISVIIITIWRELILLT